MMMLVLCLFLIMVMMTIILMFFCMLCLLGAASHLVHGLYPQLYKLIIYIYAYINNYKYLPPLYCYNYIVYEYGISPL
jgi:hypothetical protein